jgi:hypothetical protein
MTTGEQIFVQSHVARDLLQNAALFKNEKLVIWEYVSNGLEYIDEGTNPEVSVLLDNKKKRIVVIDNGRGMNWTDLQNFFVMHGENIDRKKGRPGRGRFGTGKSAAFGIADVLRVTTIRNGKRSKVELRRQDIEAMDSLDPIRVRLLEREAKTTQPNGTTVEIGEINYKSLDQAGVIHYIERHLAKLRNASVTVNNRPCEFTEPSVSEIRIFHPEGPLKDKLGEVELVIKVASAPIEEELWGVSIFANGVWHETTLSGSEKREMSQYIFGEIDIPELDKDKSPIPPFDLSRSMRLNPSNELVQAIYAFVGQKIDQVRRELVKAQKKRRESEDAKKLAQQAQMIAQVINEDFIDFRQRVAKAKAKGGKGFDLGSIFSGGAGQDELVVGTEVSAEIIAETGDPGAEGDRGKSGSEPRKLQPQVSPAPPSEKKQGRPAEGKEGPLGGRGGFDVEFKNMGVDESRALYVSKERTIYINLDHPQLVCAKGTNSTEDPLFQRLSYEVAFSEYAIALAHELNQNNEYIDTSDPIFDIRDAINRVARKAAQLYSI